MKALDQKFMSMREEAQSSDLKRAEVLGRLYSSFKRPMSRYTELETTATIAQIHADATIANAPTEILYREINRRCSLDSEPIAAIEDRWTVPATCHVIEIDGVLAI
jgi:hypothetical protein